MLLELPQSRPWKTLKALTHTTKKAALFTKAAFFNLYQPPVTRQPKPSYSAEILSTAVLPERSSTFVSYETF